MASDLLLPPCVHESHSSHDAEPALRRDAWREIAHWQCEFMPSPEVPLDADIHILRSDKCIFGGTRSSAYEMRTHPKLAEPLEELVVVSLIHAGELRLNAGPGESRHMDTGTLALFDPRQAGHYRWSHNARQAFIDLPRREVFALLGREPGNEPIALNRCALAPALASQLNHLARMARQPHLIDGAEYAGLLESTRMLALLTMRNLGRNGERADLPDIDEDLNRGRHAAALRFMHGEAHRHDLDADAIAHGAGCSRTRLYAAFAAREETVMETLREIRLQRARAQIEATPRLHLGALSWRCGFADQSGFSKLFKARFGMSPKEWHRRAWGGTQVDSESGFP
jgi:AraC-like DNA-binding protein